MLRRRPSLERLEERRVLAADPIGVFATLDGVQADEPREFRIDSAAFPGGGDSQLIRLDVAASDQSDTNVSLVVTRDAVPIEAVLSMPGEGGSGAIGLYDLGVGDYSVVLDDFGADAGFTIQASLVGDFDGDFDVDEQDYGVWLRNASIGESNNRGDFNADGRVDAADYTVWRDSVGEADLTPFSGADGDGDGDVDDEDYLVWRYSFGQTAAGLVTADFAVGDFNVDGRVDAADYTVWRDNLGIESGASVPQGDADGDGDVDEIDYQLWVANFGATPISGDADLDGDTDSDDFTLWRPQLGVATTIRPIELSVGVERGDEAVGLLASVLDDETFAIAGTTIPNAVVEIDSNGDAIADQTVNSDASGRFSFDLLLSEVGDASITVTAEDNFGQIVSRDVALTVLPSLTVDEVSPRNGEGLVVPSRESVVHFSRPVDPATVTSDSVYAIAAGRRLPARLAVNAAETTATLFYDDPLPPSTTVRVVVEGDRIIGRNGKPLDANGDGQLGGTGASEFRTQNLTPIAGTSVSGFIYDSNRTTPEGENIPIVGLTLRVVGRPELTTVTDETGGFTLQDVPAPEFFVELDASTATNAPDGFRFVGTTKPFHSVAGEATVLNKGGEPFDIFLPLAKDDDMTPIVAGEMTMVEFSETSLGFLETITPNIPTEKWELLQLEVPPDSLVDNAGAPANEVRIFPLDMKRIPAPVPEGFDPAIVFSIDAGGAENFDVPAKLTYPNVDGLAPGEQRFIYSFDHDVGSWSPTGTLTVSIDGSVLESDDGVRTVGWRFIAPDPSSNPQVPINDGGDGDSGADCSTTQLTIDTLSIASTVVTFGVTATSAPLTWALFTGLGVGLAVEDIIRNYDDFSSASSAATVISSGFSIGDYLAVNTFRLTSELLQGASRGLSAFGLLGPASNIFECVTGIGVAPATSRDIGSSKSEASFAPTSFEAFLDTPSDSFATFAEAFARESQELQDALLPLISDKLFAHPQSDEFATFVSDAEELIAIGPDGNPVIDAGSGEAIRLPIADLLDNRIDDPGFYNPILIAAQSEVDSLEEFVWRNEQLVGDLDGQLDDSISSINASVATREYQPAGTLVYSLRDLVDNGLVQRGVVRGASVVDAIVPPGRAYLLSVVDLGDQSVGHLVLRSGASGSTGASAYESVGIDELTLYAPTATSIDTDADGLLDAVEDVIGTSTASSDSDGDGIDDLAEIQQGLDPLEGVGFPTGVVAALELPGEAMEVVVRGELDDPTQLTAFVATGNHGLALVEASQFNAPSSLGQIDLEGFNNDVAVSDDLGLAVVAGGSSGLHIVDVSDPLMPTLVETLGDFGSISRVELVDGVVYAAGDELLQFELANGELLDRTDLGASINDLAVEGGRLYAVTDDQALHIIDLFAAQPTLLGTVTLSDPAERVFVGSGVAYVSNRGTTNLSGAPPETRLILGGYSTVDVSDPANPVVISGVDTPEVQSGNLQTVTNGSGLALVAAGFRGLEVHSAGDDGTTYDLLTAFDTPGQANSVAVASGIAFVADYTGGLQVINYSQFDTLGVAPTVAIDTDAIDIDDDTPGIQVLEGSSIAVLVDIADDVQVRNAELLVDGELVANDVAFPFDFRVVAPSLSSGATEVAIQVAATDTGGNTGMSNAITLEVVPDTFPPSVVAVSPGDGSVRFEGHETIRVNFSEPMGDATLVVANFPLANLTAGETAFPTAIESRKDGTEVLLTYDPLAIGDFEFSVLAGVADRAGNPLDADLVLATFRTIEDIDPGDDLIEALDLGVLSGSFFLEDTIGVDDVGGPDPADVLRFELAEAGTLTAFLRGRTDGGQVRLVADKNEDGVFDSADLLDSAGSSGTGDLRLDEDLPPGSYFVWINGWNTNDVTDYSIELSVTSLPALPVDPGGSIDTALDLGVLDSEVTLSDVYAAGIDNDVFRFELTQATAVTAALTGRTEGADFWLLADKDGDGVFDSADTLESANGSSSSDREINEDLPPGVYYVWINGWDSSSASRYDLTLTPTLLPVLPTDPGGSIDTALDLGVLDSEVTLSDVYAAGIDNDVFRFELTQATAVTAALTGRTEGADFWLLADKDGDGVFDSADTLESANGSSSSDREINEDLPPGVYYVWINGWDSSSASRYDLTLTPTLLPVLPTDPGGSIDTALDLGVLDSEVTLSDVYAAGIDNDVFRFELTQATAVTAALTGRTEGADFWLLADKDGDGVFDSADTLESANGSSSSDREINEDLPPGVYYVWINGWDSSSASRYDLTLTPTLLPVLPTDPGGSIDTALDLGVLDSEVTLSDVYAAGIDNDVFRFELTQATAVTAALTGRTEGADFWLLADKDGDGVFDSADTLESANGSSSSDREINEDLPPGVYYVWINGWDSSSASRYDLTLTPTSIALPAEADAHLGEWMSLTERLDQAFAELGADLLVRPAFRPATRIH